MRILTDIECAGRKGVFPEPDQDPVIQIANIVTLQGDNRPLLRNVFTLKKCTPIVGADVRCYETEKELLEGWRNFMEAVSVPSTTQQATTTTSPPTLLG